MMFVPSLECFQFFRRICINIFVVVNDYINDNYNYNANNNIIMYCTSIRSSLHFLSPYKIILC